MPVSGRFLLDTNIVIALLEGDDGVLSNLDQASEVFIPATVVGELFFGAAKSGRPGDNTAKIEEFVAGRSILVRCARGPRVRTPEATASGKGKAHSGERHLDRGNRDLSRPGSGYSRPALRRS